MDSLYILDKVKNEIKKALNICKAEIKTEYLSYKSLLFVYDKLNFIYMNDNKVHKETIIGLIEECYNSLVLIDNLYKLFKRTNNNNLKAFEITYYYNTIIDYCEPIMKFRKERVEKLKEITNMIKCYKQNIQYISNKKLNNSNETIENLKKYSQYIKCL